MHGLNLVDKRKDFFSGIHFKIWKCVPPQTASTFTKAFSKAVKFGNTYFFESGRQMKAELSQNADNFNTDLRVSTGSSNAHNAYNSLRAESGSALEKCQPQFSKHTITESLIKH